MRGLALILLVGCAPAASPYHRYPSWEPPVPVEGPSFEALFLEQVGEIRVSLDEEAADALRAEPRERVRGSVRIGDQVVDASIRLKGNGSFRELDDKPSLKLTLDEPVGGVRRLVLNNTVSDPTRVRERLASHAYQLAGVPAARAGHAWVGVMGVDRGIYTVLEDVDSRFLEGWYGDGEGSLHELEDGDFTPALLSGIEHKRGPEGRETLIAVSDALALGDAIGFEVATSWVDEHAFLRYLAVTALVAQTDAYPYSNPGDDMYVYQDPATDRLTMLPHGLDESFQPRGRTVMAVPGMLARRCLVQAACREAFRGHLIDATELLASWPDEVERVRDLSAGWGDDPRLRWDGEGDDWHTRMSVFDGWLERRSAAVLAEVAQ